MLESEITISLNRNHDVCVMKHEAAFPLGVLHLERGSDLSVTSSREESQRLKSTHLLQTAGEETGHALERSGDCDDLLSKVVKDFYCEGS